MEQERPIEKLLRAYAKKRRDEAGAPTSLHPATRRMLQGEVGREIKPAPVGDGPAPKLSRLWPRLAWALGILVVLGLVASVMVPKFNGPSESGGVAENRPTSVQAPGGELAYVSPAERARDETAPGLQTVNGADTDKNKAAFTENDALRKRTLSVEKTSTEVATTAGRRFGAQNEPAIAVPPAPTQTGQPIGTANEAEALRRKDSLFETKVTSAQPVLPSTPLSNNLIAQAKPDLLLNEEMRSQVKLKAEAAAATAAQPAAATPVPAAAVFSDSLSSRDAETVTQTQRFRQIGVTPTAGAGLADKRFAEPSANVLASFQVEQSGLEVRIVDSDGSLYSGYTTPLQPALRLQSANTETQDALQRPAAERKLQTGANGSSPAAESVFFVVTGTNRSLKLPVVFSGRIATTNAAAFALTTNAQPVVGGALGGTSAASGTNSALGSSRISGKATLGGNKVIDVDAVPAGK